MSDSDLIDVNSNSGITVPVRPEKFGEFLSGLLSKPRQIARTLPSSFLIDIDTCLDLYHLVDQRVTEQGGFPLVAFTFEALYNDGRSITLRSVDELKIYREMGTRRCLGVVMNWTYLIKPQDTEVPAKQQIELSFYSGEKSSEIDLSKQFSLLRVSNMGEARISYIVHHTHVSWGYDIANMLDQKIDELTLKDSLSKFARTRTFSYFVSTLIMFAFAYVSLLSVSILSPTDELTVDRFLILEASGFRYYVISITILSMIICFRVLDAIEHLIKRFFQTPPPSGICLSEKSSQEYNARLRKHGRRWPLVAISLISTAALGYFVNELLSGIFVSLSEASEFLSD